MGRIRGIVAVPNKDYHFIIFHSYYLTHLSIQYNSFYNCKIIYYEGPLTYTKDGKTTLYGVVSFSMAAGPRPTKITYPDESFFTRVAHPDILEWIHGFMRKSEKNE